ncbi:MAG: aldehyde dehydrogenase family protein [Pseudomonadota bacterium]
MNLISPATIEAVQAFAARPHQLFIDGRWVDPTEAGQPVPLIETLNPSSAERLGAVPAAGEPDIDRAVAAARRCFEEDWSQRDARARSTALRKMAELVDGQRDFLACLETMDIGTPVALTGGQMVDSWIDALEYFAGAPSRIAGETLSAPGSWRFTGRESQIYTLKEPLGVVGAILPWNAPGSFFINKVAPALAAGCTMVIKPAEQAPLTALYLAQLFEEAGLPPGAINVVTGDGAAAGQSLARHLDVDKITFTGSTAVGQSIMRDGADSLKRLTLELGGKSAFVVMSDADMDSAIQFLVMMGVFSAGQFCMCPSRVFVEKSIIDRFNEKLAAAMGSVNIGSALDHNTQMGPLITRQQRSRVTALVDGARQEGAEVLLGGKELDTGGFHYHPTLLFHPDTRLEIAREEVFGPVLLSVPFDENDLEGVIGLANETHYGLAASVWTNNLKLASTMVRRFQAGIVGINSHGFVDPRAPFGGVKHSGLGREFGVEGLESFLETKTVTAFY